MSCAISCNTYKYYVALHFLLKGKEMKNISLIKVTFAVVVTALTSSLVSATDVIPEIAPALATHSTINVQFEQLDADKDSLLSLVETEKSKLIHIAFTKIDSNSDATISKDEFAKYITK
jgi:hypothetical protein